MHYVEAADIREGFSNALLDLGEKDRNIIAMAADLKGSVKMTKFAERYPRQFFQMGISESDMMGTAAGIALTGKTVFPGTFAVFAASLANQSVRLSIAYNKANVKIVAGHGGVTVGGDGATHQAFEDIALMRVLPGMTVIVPADANEAYHATMAAAAMKGPVYLRFARSPHPVFTEPNARFGIGVANTLTEGNDVGIIATGSMVARALEAAEKLASSGIEARVVNMHTIKPLDEECIRAAATECRALVTVEEHSIYGGLGGAVSEFVSTDLPVPVIRVGIQDTFGESGEPQEVLKKFGLTSAAISEAAEKAMKMKASS